jgi:protein required for attachment to host cells
MSTTWILVANASQAKLYANTGPKKGLKLVKDLKHPESREKASDLVSDRPARCTARATAIAPASRKPTRRPTRRAISPRNWRAN